MKLGKKMKLTSQGHQAGLWRDSRFDSRFQPCIHSSGYMKLLNILNIPTHLCLVPFLPPSKIYNIYFQDKGECKSGNFFYFLLPLVQEVTWELLSASCLNTVKLTQVAFRMRKLSHLLKLLSLRESLNLDMKWHWVHCLLQLKLQFLKP